MLAALAPLAVKDGFITILQQGVPVFLFANRAGTGQDMAGIMLVMC